MTAAPARLTERLQALAGRIARYQLCRRDREAGANLCRRALSDGNEELLVKALTCVPSVLPRTEAIASLRQALRHPSKSVRSAAQDALGGMGPSVVRPLVECLQDTDKGLRASAALALSHLGRRARAAVPALVVALADTSISVRIAAARALGAVGPAAREAGQSLCELVRSNRNAAVRMAALAGLQGINADVGLVVPLLIHLLRERQPQTRDDVLATLRAIGPDASVTAPLLWESIRRESSLWGLDTPSRALAAILPSPDCILPELLKALRERQSVAQLAALKVLAEATFAIEPCDFAEPLIDIITQDSREHLEVALQVVTGFHSAPAVGGPRLRKVISRLCQLAVSDLGWNRPAARDALRAFDPSGKVAVPELRQHFLSGGPDVRRRAVTIIGDYATGRDRNPSMDWPPVRTTRYGLPGRWPCNEQAGHALVKALRDPDEFIRRDAAAALGRAGSAPAAAVPRLRRLACSDSDAVVRLKAAVALFHITGDAAPAGTVLTLLFGPSNIFDIRDALWALKEIGPGGASLRPALEALLGREERSIHTDVLRALAVIGPPHDTVLGLLRGRIQGKHWWERIEAVRMLGWLRPAPAEAVVLLRGALAHRGKDTRETAAEALGLLDPPSREATPDLVRLLRSPKSLNSRAAAVALLRMGEETRAALAALSAPRRDKQGMPVAYSRSYYDFGPSCLLRKLRDEAPGGSRAALATALTDTDESIRCLAAINLAGLWGERTDEAVRVMADVLRDDPDDGRLFLRVEAAQTLGELGQGAMAVLPTLTSALPRLHSWALRAAVWRTIARLRSAGAAPPVSDRQLGRQRHHERGELAGL